MFNGSWRSLFFVKIVLPLAWVSDEKTFLIPPKTNHTAFTMTNKSPRNWYLVSSEHRRGPYPQDLIIQALRKGKINRNLGACPENSDKWQPIFEWSEFSQSCQVSDSKGTSQNSSPPILDIPNTPTYQQSMDEMIGDLNRYNFAAEVLPVDLSNFSRLTKDPFFWGIIFLGIAPLLICTFNSAQVQSTGMAFLFAALWGFVFKILVARNERDNGLSLAAFFFTGIIGIGAYFVLMRFLPTWYGMLPNSSNVFMRLIGSIVHTGITEELCKFVPAGLYLLWKRRTAKPIMIVWIAICSALGFAAFENLLYAKSIAVSIAISIAQAADENWTLLEAVEAILPAMFVYVLRLLSCVFGHAVWAGIFAYFVAVAFVTRHRVIIHCCLGLLLAAVFHGTYNWFSEVQPTFAAASVAVAFVLFYGYLTKLRSLIGEEESTFNLTDKQQ